ncbi:MAG TPA: glycosyltransferase family 39 protein [Candidatus Acidoferrales bacterium]|nr:glycosyltransferase family 39 protein [Candidatus Acidoferrales bacterium]
MAFFAGIPGILSMLHPHLASAIMALLFEVSVASKIAPNAVLGNVAPPGAGPTANSSLRDRKDLTLLFCIGAGTLLVHLLAAGRYGFNRDELAILEDARHLAWGYVAYPPLTPFFGRLALALFGTSLVGFRFFSALVQAISVVLTGCMAKDMGGGRAAQVVAACASIPFSLGAGALMQYMSFDYFAWVLTAFFLVRVLKTPNPRYFLLVGASIGLGMLAKYTMLFFAVGVLGGLLLTDARKYLRTIWPWLGLLISLLMVAPNFLWQVQHHFVTYDFLRFIHQRDVAEGLTRTFLPDQLEMTLLSFPLWIAGLYFCLRSREGRNFRPLAWIFLVTLVLFLIAKGRGYYLAPAYPTLYAAGGVWGERWLSTLNAARAKIVRAAIAAALILSILGAMAVALPLAPVHSTWFRLADRVNLTLGDEIGWEDLVSTLAQLRDSLPAESRAHLGILAENYGEVGAINLYGPRYGLPHAISGVNSSWERGYGNPPPQTLIIVGFPRAFVEANFDSCRLVAQNTNSLGVVNEETTERREIFLCGPPKAGWQQFWRNFQYYA